MPRKRDFDNLISKLGFQNNYGLYRKVLLDLANYLYENFKLEDALLTYLEISFLDTNELQKNTAEPDKKIMELFPASHQSGEIQKSGIVDKIHQLSYEMELNNSDLKERYFVVASRIQKNKKTTVNPEFGWKRFEKEFQEYSNKKGRYQ